MPDGFVGPPVPPRSSIFSGLGGLFGDLAGGLGGFFDEFDRTQRIRGIEDRANFQNQNVNAGGVSGFISGDQTRGGFSGRDALIQDALGTAGLNLLGGATGFGTGDLGGFLQNLPVGNIFNTASSLLGQQLGPSAFGTLGGLAGTAGLLGNQFAAQSLAGPTDLTGGAQGALFGSGLSNLAGAGNTDALRQNFLNTQRAAASGGLLDQAINRLQDRQFAQGRLGSTGGAQETERFLDAIASQDLGFQNNAFGLAQAEAERLGNLGLGQIAAGGGLLGQNLGQFNQAGQFAQNFLGLGAGLEGQQFGQNLQSLAQNQSSGLQRLQAASGLLGLGSDIFGGAQARGLAGLELAGTRQAQLRDFLLGLRNAESDRIQAAGASSQALAGADSGGLGGFLGGIGRTLLGGLF